MESNLFVAAHAAIKGMDLEYAHLNRNDERIPRSKLRGIFNIFLCAPAQSK